MIDKNRLIQEYVPGKQITMAHIIASPNHDSYEKLGILNNSGGAIGVLTITPSEASVIAVDIALKSGDVEIGFIDRFSGSVVLTGDLTALEVSLSEVLYYMHDTLNFNVTSVTKT